MPTAFSDTIRSTIVSELKLDGFTRAEQDELIDFLEENCVIQVHNTIIANLEEDDKNRFYELSEYNEPEKIKAFLEKALPHFRELVEEASQSVVQEFIKLQSK